MKPQFVTETPKEVKLNTVRSSGLCSHLAAGFEPHEDNITLVAETALCYECKTIYAYARHLKKFVKVGNIS